MNLNKGGLNHPQPLPIHSTTHHFNKRFHHTTAATVPSTQLRAEGPWSIMLLRPVLRHKALQARITNVTGMLTHITCLSSTLQMHVCDSHATTHVI